MAGVELGDVLSITEIVGNGSGNFYNSAQFRVEDLGGDGGGITPGELQMTTNCKMYLVCNS